MLQREQDGIAYVSAGWPLDPDKPTLHFIHGAGGSHVLWLEQIEGLAGLANAVAIDLPGHGASRGEGMDSIEGYAKVVAEEVNGLSWTFLPEKGSSGIPGGLLASPIRV